MRDWNDIQCKVVSYKLEQMGYERSENHTRVSYERVIKDPSTVEIIWNVTFYCSVEIAKEIQMVGNENLYRMVDDTFKHDMELRFREVVNRHYMNGDIHLEGSNIPKDGMAVFYKDDAFKLYQH